PCCGYNCCGHSIRQELLSHLNCRRCAGMTLALPRYMQHRQCGSTGNAYPTFDFHLCSVLLSFLKVKKFLKGNLTLKEVASNSYFPLFVVTEYGPVAAALQPESGITFALAILRNQLTKETGLWLPSFITRSGWKRQKRSRSPASTTRNT